MLWLGVFVDLFHELYKLWKSPLLQSLFFLISQPGEQSIWDTLWSGLVLLLCAFLFIFSRIPLEVILCLLAQEYSQLVHQFIYIQANHLSTKKEIRKNLRFGCPISLFAQPMLWQSHGYSRYFTWWLVSTCKLKTIQTPEAYKMLLEVTSIHG